VNSPWAGVDRWGCLSRRLKDIVLKNVDIQATKGLQIAYGGWLLRPI